MSASTLSSLTVEYEAESYIDDLWFLLHHSEDEDGLVWGLTFYLDDSGSDDGSPLVTCGGVLMDRPNFQEFSKRWGRMYARNRHMGNYTLEPPLHMRDFVGDGKYAGLYPEFRRALFLDVARLINEHKFYSASVAVSQREYEQELKIEVRRNLISPYAFAFFALILVHQEMSNLADRGPFKTSYLVDHGFSFQEHLNQAHKLVQDFEKSVGGIRHTGALGTDSDDSVPALQAADVIAWTSRCIALHGQLPEGFEPLTEILNEGIAPPHATIPLPRGAIKMLAIPINKWISEKGSLPKLSDIAVRRTGNGFAWRLK